MSTHLAAVLNAPGQPLSIQTRRTPKPGPNELLIAVKSIALNPADIIIGNDTTQSLIPATRFQNDSKSNSNNGIILGFDLSGIVLEVGDNVLSTSASITDGASLKFEPGKTRIAAYSVSFWKSWDPDYGAFQEKCLVPWEHCVILPDEISFNEGVTLGVAVSVALNAWEALGLPVSAEGSVDGGTVRSSGVVRDESESGRMNLEEMEEEGEALLIWGASSSVGSMGVQTARVFCDHRGNLKKYNTKVVAVYATAGAANMNYVESLGADRVFDYKDPDVTRGIVSAAREDGLVIRRVFLATGDLEKCRDVLRAFLPDTDTCDERWVLGGIASAPPIPPQGVDNSKFLGSLSIETVFVMPSIDEETRLKQFKSWLGVWLHERLRSGEVRPSPPGRIVGRGLESLNDGLDVLRKGVSYCKLVIELKE